MRQDRRRGVAEVAVEEERQIGIVGGIPDEDQGILMVQATLPGNSSARTGSESTIPTSSTPGKLE